MSLEQWLSKQSWKPETSLAELQSIHDRVTTLIEACEDWDGRTSRRLTEMSLLELKRWLTQEMNRQETYKLQAFDRKLLRGS